MLRRDANPEPEPRWQYNIDVLLILTGLGLITLGGWAIAMGHLLWGAVALSLSSASVGSLVSTIWFEFRMARRAKRHKHY